MRQHPGQARFGGRVTAGARQRPHVAPPLGACMMPVGLLQHWHPVCTATLLSLALVPWRPLCTLFLWASGGCSGLGLGSRGAECTLSFYGQQCTATPNGDLDSGTERVAVGYTGHFRWCSGYVFILRFIWTDGLVLTIGSSRRRSWRTCACFCAFGSLALAR